MRRRWGVIKTLPMKNVIRFSRHRARRTDAAQRSQLLAQFDRSGLSAAAFARQEGIHYTTFCGWRQRRDQAKASPDFVQVELTPSAAPVDLAKAEVVIEPGVARLRLSSPVQLPLAARLLQCLNAPPPC
jgi:hypothetical protein